MKRIGANIGVNESRVSQLHARAVQRLRCLLAATDGGALGDAVVPFAAAAAKKQMARASLSSRAGQSPAAATHAPGVVVAYPSTSRASRSRSASLNGLVSQRQPLSSRKRSASVPATSPVTKITRRASDGDLAAMAR